MKAPLREYVPLAPYTTLSIGGPARYFIHAAAENTVAEAVQFTKERQIPIFVLGGGSNLLVADAGFPGLVLQVGITGLEWLDEGIRVRLNAGAGEVWDTVVANCVDRDLAGVECLSGIPGLVGGTPVQNIGAYGQEVSETLTNVRAYDRQSDRLVDLDRRDCAFGYRSSAFNSTDRDRYIVLNVSYLFQKHGTPQTRYAEVQKEFETITPSLAKVREAVRRIRASKAMLLQPGDPDCRSAGSFFKNPVMTAQEFANVESAAERAGCLKANERLPRYASADGKIKTAAAWLIERAGFQKGFSRGAVGISSRHTLALINKGGANAADLIALAREIRKAVEDRFGVKLVPEPVLVGFADDVI